VAVVAIVIGHVVAVSVAHIIALREYSNRRVALRSQVPMLILMVVYTMVGLWIIAQRSSKPVDRPTEETSA
jgi:uncharacterized membrane protein YfcA